MPDSDEAQTKTRARVTSKKAAALKAPEVNQQGQTIGRKGQETRERLVRAVEILLQSIPLRELTLAEVCRIAKVSPPAFYVYFKDIETVVLEAIARNQVLPPKLEELLLQAWPPAEVFQKAKVFVALYLEHWNQNYHLFKTRNLSADEGDQKMIDLRLRFQVPILEQIAAKIAEGQTGDSNNSLAPLAGAAIVMSSMERLAPTLRFQLHTKRRDDLTNDDVINAAAWVLARMIADH